MLPQAAVSCYDCLIAVYLGCVAMFLKIPIAIDIKEVVRPKYSNISGKPMAYVNLLICK